MKPPFAPPKRPARPRARPGSRNSHAGKSELTRLEALVREQAASIAHYKKMYDRASALAHIGAWECDLADNSLTWTDGVYDLFGITRGAPLDREAAARLYFEESRIEMERLRAEAIRNRGGFCMDAHIHSADGVDRWIRITADVECEDGVPVRLFGLKQDVTQEKALWDTMRVSAEYDPLTGLANRAVFQTRFFARPEHLRQAEPLAALLLVDMDGFKQINDNFGHSAGDECLRQAAVRLRGVYGDSLLTARIGGDEFAVLLEMPRDRGAIEGKVERLLRSLERPVPWSGRSLAMSASIGIAMTSDPVRYDPSQLFTDADLALYAAKAAGRNTFRTHIPGWSGIQQHKAAS